MPSIYQIKPRFQALLRPLVRALAAAGGTANQVTVAAALMSIAAGIVLTFDGAKPLVWLLLPVVLFLRMALNAIDGMLAREHGQKSPLGAFLNELCDVISDAAFYLPFALVAAPLIVVLTVIVAALTELAGVVALQIGAERRYDGPMGKSDRAFAFGLLAVLLGIGLVPGLWTTLYLVALLVLSALTVVNRARRIVADAKGRA
jgi:CDP-diacylglycerol--glycerol-3-phosphate 3-phosphatidyltransferase